MTTVTVVGLGEAGAIYARGLRDAGYDVRGFDPFTQLDEPRIEQHEALADALEGTELVITLVGAKASKPVLQDVLANLSGTPVIADLNTGSPALKAELEQLATASGAPFVDAAVLAPVPRNGVRSPLMVSGTGAAQFIELFASTDAPVESVPGDAGQAAARKLLRSTFMKSLATVVIESTRAAEAAGAGDWMRAQIEGELGEGSAALVTRLIEGTQQHAARRLHEMEDTSDYLVSIGQRNWMAEGTKLWLAELDNENQRSA